ncbi:MAG TPA: galactokinase, partial [Clostridiales bacterium]|nr:galactokinase [Clostridiales bacterium]
MKSKLFLSQLAAGEWHVKLASLYGDEKVSSAVTRYTDAVGAFEQRYGKDRDIAVFSVCGRSEISGNHTDHNHGKVIAASIELDIIAVASHNDNGTIRVLSRGFDEDTITPESKTKQYSSASLIAGVKEGFRKEGLLVGGFDAYTDSYVLKGSGLSSSAAYENMIGTILNH